MSRKFIMRGAMIICLQILNACQFASTQAIESDATTSWTAAPRINLGALTPEQIQKAKWVRVIATRNSSTLASKEVPYETGSVSLLIPSPGSITIEISGLSQARDTVYWFGITTVSSGQADGGMVVLLAGPGLDPNSVFNPKITYGSQAYETVKIGSQVWMKENLNYSGPSGNVGVCYNGERSNCDNYGRLYTFAQATNGVKPTGTQIIKGICPDGWHLPSLAEWDTLKSYVEWDPRVGPSNANIALRSITGWVDVGGTTGIPIGSDLFGFSALPSGNRSSDGYFYNIGRMTWFWASTMSISTSSMPYSIWLNASGTFSGSPSSPDHWFSIRCIKD